MGLEARGICHDQARGFADGLSRGVGIDNALLNLNGLHPCLISLGEPN